MSVPVREYRRLGPAAREVLPNVSSCPYLSVLSRGRSGSEACPNSCMDSASTATIRAEGGNPPSHLANLQSGAATGLRHGKHLLRPARTCPRGMRHRSWLPRRGVYFGTNDPQINIDRIEQRVFAGTGHMVDPHRIPERWRCSLSNLRRTAEQSDQLQLLDNSEHDDFHLPRPVEQCRLERRACLGRPKSQSHGASRGLPHRQAELRR